MHNHKYTINKGAVSIPAWRIGVLLQGWDRMDGASNKNGIYKIQMSVDDTLRYGVTMDSVNWDETAYIKTHIDYTDKQDNKRTTVRCYPMPGNELNIYESTNRNGIIRIYSSEARKIEIKASDFSGNISSIQFDVKRSNKMIKNTSSKGYIGCAHALKTLNYLKDLSTVNKEMLFIAGENDMGAPAMAMEEMSHLTPNSKYVCIPGAAHVLNIESPEQYFSFVIWSFD